MMIDKLYLVLNWEDPECSPNTVGIFTELDMAMQAAKVCADAEERRFWRWHKPQGSEVMRLECDQHIIIVEAVKHVCKPDHWLFQQQVRPTFSVMSGKAMEAWERAKEEAKP